MSGDWFVLNARDAMWLDGEGRSAVCLFEGGEHWPQLGVNVGIMMFNDQNQGSYVRFPMSSMTSANVTSLQTLTKGMDIGSATNKVGSNSTYEDKMNDVFRYFNSLQTFTQNAAPTVANVGGYVDSSKNNFKFLSGQGGDTCGYDYVVFIGNAFPNTQSWTANPPAGGAADLVAAAALLNDSANVSFGTNNANLVPLQNSGSNADVWAKFMFNYGVKVAFVHTGVKGVEK